ncbi:hypothetical protein U1Q18_032639 [Sarracenia purpurea var. burkii]
MKESKQSSSWKSKKSKQSRDGILSSGSGYQVLAHWENEGTVVSPDTSMVSLTESSSHVVASPAKSRRDVFNGRIQRLKGINLTTMFTASSKEGSEGEVSTPEVPELVSEEVDLEVENNLGADDDSGIGDCDATQGGCEDWRIKSGIDVDEGNGEVEEMISNSGCLISRDSKDNEDT